MAPIYDTDIAEERWSRAEWNQYELWEKVELRIRHRKRLWIAATALAVFGLFSIPIITDQRPKWETLKQARTLASEINWIKREAGVQHQAFRLVFAPAAGTYRIEKLRSCSAPELVTPVRESPLNSPGGTALSVLDPQRSTQLGLEGLVTEICYDPFTGSSATNQSGVGIGVIPTEDLDSGRTDRLSVVLVNGPTADISID